ADEPEAWLGAAHVQRYGADPALLVKLLDAGPRLPLHVHPDRRFATAHLASPYGKTEAWVTVDAVPDASVHLGFRWHVAPDGNAGRRAASGRAWTGCSRPPPTSSSPPSGCAPTRSACWIPGSASSSW